MLRRLSYGQSYILLGILLAAALVASAGIGAFTFSPERMFRYLGEGLGWIPSVAADELGRNVFLKLRL
ncbi:MAG TPA: hypothetical protein VIQ60_05830, partial [Gemmatimonadaceae bacterium]